MTCTVSAVCRRSKRRPSLLRAACVGLLCLGLGVASWAAPAHKDKDLHIYFVDVEGGQATLFVTPAGQSLLIDTGWPGNDGRDADRIVAAARKAGISKIDYVLITHFHQDHVGGVSQLAARIPIGTFIDHGENRETGNAATVRDFQAYQAVLATGKYKHITAKPGDALPIKGMRATIVSSDGALIDKPLAGAGQENPNCKGAEQYPADTTENLRSLGTFIHFGKLNILDLGDLTHDKEMQLMCPVNKIGKVDIYVVSHHGWAQSGSPALGLRHRSPRGHHGQRRQEGRKPFGLGHHREIARPGRPLATAFFRRGRRGAQRRGRVHRQSRRSRCSPWSRVDGPSRRKL